MPRAIARRELIRKFRALGFDGPRHQFMRRGSLKVRIPTPHGGERLHASRVAEWPWLGCGMRLWFGTLS